MASSAHPLVIALAVLAWVHLGRGASTTDARIAALYRPLQADQVVLSPDGAHLAYTRHERGELAILIMAVDRPEKKFKIAVEDDRPVEFSRERMPARLRLLRWATPRRLVFAATPFHNGTNLVAAIHAINLDGSDARTLARQQDFDLLQASPTGEGPPSVITRPTNLLGFLDRERRQLLVEALGRATLPSRPPVPTTLFSLEVATGKLTTLADEQGTGRFFYDRTGRARLLYNHPHTAETRTFLHHSGGTWGRWVAFDEAHFGPVAKPFVVTLQNYYGERAFPVGFDADPNVLYFASNVGRDTYGVYGFDLEKKQRTAFAVEVPHVDLVPLEPGEAGGTLIFDEARGQVVGVRATGLRAIARWTDPELAQREGDVQRKFPGRSVELLQWDDARTRFLVRAGADGDPGRYYVYLRPENVVIEVLNRAPWLPRAELNDATAFEFETAGGAHVTGYLTLPRQPRLKPSPLLIDFSHGWTNRAFPGFDREAQALADMGFVVARVNHRGSGGFGVQHRNAIQGGIDRVPVDDAVAAIEWIARHHAIDRRRVATIGRGLGGYLALRALQLQPEVFRCGIAIDAPLDPQGWLQPPLPSMGGATPDRSPTITRGLTTFSSTPPINFRREALRTFVEHGNQRGISVLRHVEELTRPVMLIVDAPRDPVIAAQAGELRSALRRRDRVVDYVETDTGVAFDLPGARAKLYRQIEGFFNLNLYDFDVKIGPVKEIK